MNTIAIDTVVVGGGHAGLCMSFALQQENREHIVIEKKRMLEQRASHDGIESNMKIYKLV